MKINFLMFIVFFSFVTILGLMFTEYKFVHDMSAKGLQQCLVEVGGTKTVIWQKSCL